ncbi:MAG: Lar family restriction alleviation protein [Treponema sp.]|jgi:Lar family restriction alleviation protein|nr:Lar family restriction alleviation protein [Treponema sp.]
MTTELKPCPFCGEKVVSVQEICNGFNQTVCWEFSCGNRSCGVKTNIYIKDRDMAIAAWNNKRAAQEEKI